MTFNTSRSTMVQPSMRKRENKSNELFKKELLCKRHMLSRGVIIHFKGFRISCYLLSNTSLQVSQLNYREKVMSLQISCGDEGKRKKKSGV